MTSRWLGRSRDAALLCALFAIAGCRKAYVVPETPMPPNTVMLSQMMRELSSQPGFTEALLKQLDANGKGGPAMMTPKLIDELRKRILGNDWQGLDRFPGWTMREVNPTVRTVGHFAGKSEKLEDTSAVHPGAAPTSAQTGQFIDLGPYALDKSMTEQVGIVNPETSSAFTPFNPDGIVSNLGDGVIRGDGPNALAPDHYQSQQLADMLNRLAANSLDHAKPFTAGIHGSVATTPQDFIQQLIDAGATVSVDDARYFANFGHLHYNGKDVMMPFFINSEIIVPHSHGRPLLVPVSHAEYEWHVHLQPQACGGICPRINADISYYFGIDGKAEWRTMDTLDQAWVQERNAHEYTGKDAVEVTRLVGLMTVAYLHEHADHPTLPFGGYYALGVCQDGVSAIEKKMTGKVTLFPNTIDVSLFNDPRDPEINALMAALPKDREGKRPEPERIFGSLPTTNFNSIMIPGLAADLNASYAAWKDGTLERTYTTWEYVKALSILLSAVFIAIYFAVKTRKFLDANPMQRNQRR